MANIIDFFKKEEKVKALIEESKKDSFSYLANVLSSNQNYLLAASLFLSTNNTVFFVVPNQYKANAAYDNFCELLGYENVSLYTADDEITTELITASSELKLERLNTIKNIFDNQKKIIITHPSAILKPVISKESFSQNILKITKNSEINVKDFTNRLLILGYKKVPTTVSSGEFSVRGGVIDIFPAFYKTPIRLDLFDEEIEVIKEYDPETQKSIGKINEVEVFPLNEYLFSSEIIEKAKNKILDCSPTLPSSVYRDMDNIEGYNFERSGKYINYFEKEPTTLFEYINEKIVIYDDLSRLKEAYDAVLTDLNGYMETVAYPKNLDLFYYYDFNNIYYNINKAIYLSDTKKSLPGIKLDAIYTLNGYPPTDYQNNLKVLIEDIKQNHTKTYVICLGNEEKLNLIYETFKENNLKCIIAADFNTIKKSAVNLIVCDNAIGYGFYDSNTLVLSEKEIFKNIKFKKTKYRSVYQNTVSIASKDDISPGDYVVHYDYGIGKYLGIKTVELGNIKNDYLLIKFENMELYMPVEKINLLDKYQGTEGSIPKLTKLGTKDWEKKRQKIREKISTVAKDLILLQAKRETIKGYTFKEDSDFQTMFEDDFDFEETKDQIKAITEIKHDMESGMVIDRLVCGDVGYGKTEIAMRIAFKTILEGMQVAYLAPTTILTRQHYQTFKNRFEKYGIKVELLNRLVEEKKQNEVIEELKRGTVDVVIGTHRILSEDIKYKNLGLLIVDEEQRFGVTHKEKIKKLKENVNVLTLTATPIPRTLQMSMMGVRQISLIETPPANRYPIQTFVLEENKMVVKEAIYREINRGGQVFYLHNRIGELDHKLDELSKLVPEAKITVIHGKMTKERVEDTIQSFIDGEYNVLLCTTIIETGIDIPNTNTIIIDNADLLGLAQIYQIRGRVGRSDRVAYAYLMYKEDKILTDTASKRLSAIKEFTNLGNGYKIAVRDLAIRGAGDILGKEQSGFIDTIGLDMYMKMLNEEIAKVKGEYKEDEKTEKPYIEVSRHVDETYVSDDDIKILIHKEINNITSKEEKEKVINEFTDRFGKLNEEILLYIEKIYLESLLLKYKITNLLETTYQVVVSFTKEETEKLNIPKIMEICYKISENVYIEHRGKQLIIKIKKSPMDKTWIYLLSKILESI